VRLLSPEVPGSLTEAWGTTPVPRFRSEGGHGPDAWVELGSITKTVTATLLQRLAQEGRLAVDDPLDAWVPECPAGTGITLRMLAEHTSGLPRLPPGVQFLSRDRTGASPARRCSPCCHGHLGW